MLHSAIERLVLAAAVAVGAAACLARGDADPVPPAPRPESLSRSLRLLFIGDSNTQGGQFTGAVAELLEQRHGFFGSGYRSVVADVGNGDADAYRPFLTIANDGAWESINFINSQQGKAYSPDGTCLRSETPDHRVEVSFYGTAVRAFYTAQPDAGRLLMSIEGGPTKEVDTAAANIEVRTALIDGLKPGWHRLRLSPVGGAPVMLTGVESFNGPLDGKAAIVHKWGRGYAATFHFTALKTEVWDSALKAIGPDWVVVMLGTNDHMNFAISSPLMLDGLGELVERVRRGAPQARIMLLSTVPIGAANSMSGRLRQRYRDQLPDLAAALGADYWDAAAACADSGIEWKKAGHTTDGIHFNRAGGQALAAKFLDALDAACRARPPAVEAFVTAGQPDASRARVENLTGWWAADATVTRDGRSRVVVWHNAVTRPLERHARAFPPRLRPLWVEDAVNGLPAIRFDGLQTALTLGNHTFAGCTAVVKLNKPGGAIFGSNLALYKKLGPGPEGSTRLFMPLTDLKPGELAPRVFVNGRQVAFDEAELPIGRYAILTVEGRHAAALLGLNEHYLRYTKGPGDPETLSYLDGDIAELVTWGPTAPQHEGQGRAVEAYLAKKYGIPLDTGDAHPHTTDREPLNDATSRATTSPSPL